MFRKGVWQSRWARERSSRDLWCLSYTSITHCSYSYWRKQKKNMVLIKKAPSLSLVMWRSLGTSKAWLTRKSPSIITMLDVLGFDISISWIDRGGLWCQTGLTPWIRSSLFIRMSRVLRTSFFKVFLSFFLVLDRPWWLDEEEVDGADKDDVWSWRGQNDVAIV